MGHIPKAHDAGSHDQPMTPAVQRVVDEFNKRTRDAAAMPAGCPTPSECRGSACHGECLPSSVKLVAHAAPSLPIVGTLIRHALSGDVGRVRAYGELLCDDMETREPGSAKYLRRIVAGDFGETVHPAAQPSAEPTLVQAARDALSYMDSVGQCDMYPADWAVAEALRRALDNLTKE